MYKEVKNKKEVEEQMKREYKLSRRTRRKITKVVRAGLMAFSLMSGYVIGYASGINDINVEAPEVVSVTPEVIDNYASNNVEVNSVSDGLVSNTEAGVTFNDIKLTAGIATVLESIGDEYPEYAYDLADVAEESIEKRSKFTLSKCNSYAI